MALGQMSSSAVLIAIPGLLAFICGIVAENKKPDGVPLSLASKVVFCRYEDGALTVTMGSLAAVFLLVCTVIGFFAVFYPYDGKATPLSALLNSKLFMVFFVLSLCLWVSASVLILWATIVQSNYQKGNMHQAPLDTCPSAKTGVLGGAAFLALDTMLFWLISLMLVSNAREDHYKEDEEEEEKGQYGQVSDGYDPGLGAHMVPKV